MRGGRAREEWRRSRGRGGPERPVERGKEPGERRARPARVELGGEAVVRAGKRRESSAMGARERGRPELGGKERWPGGDRRRRPRAGGDEDARERRGPGRRRGGARGAGEEELGAAVGSGEPGRREQRGGGCWDRAGEEGIVLVREDGGRRKRKERKGRDKERGERWKSRDLKEKEKGLIWRWKGLIAKTRKGRRVAARCRGVGGKLPGAGLGFWRLGGLGPGLGCSLANSKHF